MESLGDVYTGSEIIEALLKCFPGPERHAIEHANKEYVEIQPFLPKRCGFLWRKTRWEFDPICPTYTVYVRRGQMYAEIRVDRSNAQPPHTKNNSIPWNIPRCWIKKNLPCWMKSRLLQELLKERNILLMKAQE